MDADRVWRQFFGLGNADDPHRDRCALRQGRDVSRQVEFRRVYDRSSHSQRAAKRHRTRRRIFRFRITARAASTISFSGGANIVSTVNAGITSVADIAVNTERRRASFAAPSFIRNIGDLSNLHGLEEYDVSGFNVVQRFGSRRIGELAEFFFYLKGRQIDWTATDLEKQFPPDAVFSGGKWVKGEKAVSKK